MNIVSFNVRGCGDSIKRGRIKEILGKGKVGISLFRRLRYRKWESAWFLVCGKSRNVNGLQLTLLDNLEEGSFFFYV